MYVIKLLKSLKWQGRNNGYLIKEKFNKDD